MKQFRYLRLFFAADGKHEHGFETYFKKLGQPLKVLMLCMQKSSKKY